MNDQPLSVFPKVYRGTKVLVSSDESFSSPLLAEVWRVSGSGKQIDARSITPQGTLFFEDCVYIYDPDIESKKLSIKQNPLGTNRGFWKLCDDETNTREMTRQFDLIKQDMFKMRNEFAELQRDVDRITKATEFLTDGKKQKVVNNG